MDIEKMLHEEIARDFDKLREADLGTDEYRAGVDSITKMVDRAIELQKIESDVELKKAEHKIDKRNRLIGHGITLLSTLSGIGVVVWGTVKSIKFEETGTITTTMGRNFINGIGKFLPKK